MRIRIVAAAALGLFGMMAQDAPKKKRGLLDRLNDKLEKIDRKLDPGASQPPAANEQKEPVEARRPQTQRPEQSGKRFDRTGTCAVTGWREPATPDPVLQLPPGWSLSYMAFQPEPPQPARDFALEELGRTQSIRLVFPPRMRKEVGAANRQNRILSFRDATRPFETELTLKDGRLLAAFCDEKGVYHDSGDSRISTPPHRRTLYIDNAEFEKRGGRYIGATEDFMCPSCYFVNQLFTLGISEEKIVVLVNPAESSYYFIRLYAFAVELTIPPSSNLCQLDNDNTGCPAGTFAGFERAVEEGDSETFPGMMANNWYVKCGGVRCERRRLDNIAPKIRN